MKDEDKAPTQLIEELTILHQQIAALRAEQTEKQQAEQGWRMEQKRVEQALQQSAERLRLLHNMGQAILEAYSLAAIAHASLSHLRQLIPCQRASIALLDFDTQVMQVLAIHAESGPHTRVGTQLPFPSPSSLQQFQSGGRVVHDLTTLADLSPLDAEWQDAGLRSVANISLLAEGKLIGLLNLGSVTPHFFTSEYLDIGHEVARPLAIALQQARLQEEIRTAQAELEQRVQERTAELATANSALHVEIGERTQAEVRIAASLQEKEVLLREIHHRVKNNLQVISSLLRLQAEAVTEPLTRALFQEGQDRVRSMALVHEKLYQSADLAQIDFGEYVRHLAAHLLLSYQGKEQTVSLQIDTKVVLLGVNVAVPCGLILNELVTNALKYAFPDGRPGEIRIALRIDETPLQGGLGILEVCDNGVGLPVHIDVAETESLGLYLVQRLAIQLEGQLEVHNGHGTSFRLSFPLIQE
jgi:two-component sensor histidine kinase